MKVNFSASGFWTIEDSTAHYQGDLYLNESEGGIVLHIHIPNEGAPLSYLELPLEISFIYGTTTNGAKITLVDCTRISTSSRIGSEEVYGYQVKFMLKGVTFEKEENILFSKVKISIPGIIQWGKVSNYVMPTVDKHDVLIGLNNVNPIKIYSCDDYTFSYELTYSYPIFNLMKEEINLAQTPYLIIESDSFQSLHWFVDVAIKMKRIIEIAMGVPLGFKTIIAESPEINWEFEDEMNRVIPIEVIHALTLSQSKRKNVEEVAMNDFLFDLNELSSKGKFSQWQKVSSIMEPIIELYIDDLYNQELSAGRHFLNMIQALETYHSRMICNGTLADYKKRVESITSSARSEYRDFLLEGNRGAITLRNRIADLILSDFKFSFYTGDLHLTEFPRVIADTRNYYTHYNQKLEEKALKGEDLINAYYFLRNILEFYLLKELGFEEEFIHSRTRERIKPIRTSIEIKAADERKKNN